MSAAALTFYLFSAVLLVSAALTIFSRNPVHSVLWLIVAFVNAAGLMLLLGAEFLAMILVIVYVGTVATLFLFVVMMLNIDVATFKARLAREWVFGLTIAAILLVQIVVGVASSPIATTAAIPAPSDKPNIEAFGELLFTRYILLVEIAGLILLVALFGAVLLTVQQRAHGKRQIVAHQVSRTPGEAVLKTQPPVGKGLERELIEGDAVTDTHPSVGRRNDRNVTSSAARSSPAGSVKQPSLPGSRDPGNTLTPPEFEPKV